VNAVHALAVLLLLGAGCEGGKEERPYVTATGGDPRAGADTIRRVGCGACHQIPGIREAHGVVAGPLTDLRARSFIAGELPNTPENLVRWISSPNEVEPRTAMPNLGLDARQARNVAAYLYSCE
jgi:cytochrome c2